MMGSKLSRTVGATVTLDEADRLEATAFLSGGVKAERFTFCIGEVVFEQPNDPNQRTSWSIEYSGGGSRALSRFLDDK